MDARKEQRWSVWFHQSAVVTDDLCRTGMRTKGEPCFSCHPFHPIERSRGNVMRTRDARSTSANFIRRSYFSVDEIGRSGGDVSNILFGI